MKVNNQKHKIAAYIRVSTEEQASNPEGSIKSQEQRIRSHVDYKNNESGFGEVVTVYIDRAKSGKDTNRAELQKLLTAIRNKEVTLVLVTELSRLSRSIKDFCEIWELMRAHGCEFQSLREQFDTTTAAGEMVLYTIANISQFERKQCSERITANIRARAERGLYNGGTVPTGYELDPNKKGSLKIHPENSDIVRDAYRTFLKEGSLAAAGRSLNERGIKIPKLKQGGAGNKPRLGIFTIDNLHDMLRNKIYIGLKKYKTKEGEIKYSKACWDGIIDEDTFNEVNETLKRNYRCLKTASDKRYPFLLSQITKCGQCGNKLTGKSAHGNSGKVSYYEHSWATCRQSALNKKIFECKPTRFPVKIVEPLVWEQVIAVLSQPNTAKEIIERAKREHESLSLTKETERLKIKITGIENQIEALAEHLTKIPKNMNPMPIYDQMQKIESFRDEAKKEYDRKLSSGELKDIPASFKDYSSYLNWIKEFLSLEVAPELKQKIVKHGSTTKQGE